MKIQRRLVTQETVDEVYQGMTYFYKWSENGSIKIMYPKGQWQKVPTEPEDVTGECEVEDCNTKIRHDGKVRFHVWADEYRNGYSVEKETCWVIPACKDHWELELKRLRDLLQKHGKQVQRLKVMKGEERGE